MTLFKNLLVSLSYREAQAWIFSVINAIVLITYVRELRFRSGLVEGEGLPAFAGLIIVAVTTTFFTLLFIIPTAIILHRTANDPADERDRRIRSESGGLAFSCLSGLSVLALCAYVVHRSGDLLFHGLLMAMLVAQLMFALVTAVKYRRSSAPFLSGTED